MLREGVEHDQSILIHVAPISPMSKHAGAVLRCILVTWCPPRQRAEFRHRFCRSPKNAVPSWEFFLSLDHAQGPAPHSGYQGLLHKTADFATSPPFNVF